MRHALMTAIGSVTLVAAACPSARADYWVHEDDDPSTAPGERDIRFTPFVSLWTGNYDRPSRACSSVFDEGVDVVGPRPFGAPRPAVQRGLRAGQTGFIPFCDPDSSDELGFGAGGEVTFRIVGPLHVSAAAQLVYTIPNRDFELKNQLILPLQLGVLLTWPEWPVRPLLSAEITPLIFITDDTRDFSVGATTGLAWGVSGFGDVSFTVGHLWGDTLTGWQIRIGLRPH